MEVPGSFNSPNSSFNMSIELNTPIKKLNRLNLHSPNSNTSIYPMIDDIFEDNVTTSMLNKGYSKKLTNNVLQELNLRASNINNNNNSNNVTLDKPTSPNPIHRRNNRYSQIHKKSFQNMTSIQNHYSVKDSKNDNKDSSYYSDTKRRRTLNFDDVITYKPNQQQQINSSPIRKLSPSKKHMNLNEILTGSESNNHEFKIPSNRLRFSSLEMAGVKPTENGSRLPRKPSSSNLQKKPSLNQLSNHTLHKKSSIPTLNKKSSIPLLQKKSSIPSLQKKSSFSNLPSTTANLSYSNVESSPTGFTNKQHPPILSKPIDSKISTYKPNLSPSKSSYSINQRNTISPSRSTSTINDTIRSKSISPSKSSCSLSPTKVNVKSYQSNSSPDKSYMNPNKSYLSPSKSLHQNISSNLKISPSKSHHSLTTNLEPSNHTLGSPFSLYNKPTISSSQKSLNKFQRFKNRFD